MISKKKYKMLHRQSSDVCHYCHRKYGKFVLVAWTHSDRTIAPDIQSHFNDIYIMKTALLIVRFLWFALICYCCWYSVPFASSSLLPISVCVWNLFCAQRRLKIGKYSNLSCHSSVLVAPRAIILKPHPHDTNTDTSRDENGKIQKAGGKEKNRWENS